MTAGPGPWSQHALAAYIWERLMTNRNVLGNDQARCGASSVGSGFVAPPSLRRRGIGQFWGFRAGARDTKEEQVGLELRAGGSFGKNSMRP